jgi:hypothetical protein
MKAKGFLITKKEFITDKEFICNERTGKDSFLMFGLLKKEAIQRFVKRKRVKNWTVLSKQDWIIKKVTVKIK